MQDVSNYNRDIVAEMCTNKEGNNMHLLREDAPSPKGSNMPRDNPPRLGQVSHEIIGT